MYVLENKMVASVQAALNFFKKEQNNNNKVKTKQKLKRAFCEKRNQQQMNCERISPWNRFYSTFKIFSSSCCCLCSFFGNIIIFFCHSNKVLAEKSRSHKPST